MRGPPPPDPRGPPMMRPGFERPPGPGKLVLISRRFFLLIIIRWVSKSSHRLEKYLNLEGFLEKSLKTKSALKSTGKPLKSLEKSLNSTISCRT